MIKIAGRVERSEFYFSNKKFIKIKSKTGNIWRKRHC